MDFDDLLLKTVLLFQNHPDVLARYRERWQYLHIDEYQDTNTAQYRLSTLLAGERKNICVVGDMDQCLPAHANQRSARLHSNSAAEEGDMVYSAAGHGAVCVRPVQKVHKRTYRGDLVAIKTKNGRVFHSLPDICSLRRSRRKPVCTIPI